VIFGAANRLPCFQRDSLELFPSRCVALYAVAMLEMYAPISDVYIKYFACTHMDGGRQLSADLSISCDGTTYQSWLPAALLIGFGWVVLMPFCNFVYLWRLARNDRLEEERVAWGLVYRQFTPTCWWWQFVELSEKLLFTSVIALVEDTIIQISVFIVIVLFYCMAHAYVRPYINRTSDRIAFVGHITIYCLLLCAFLLESGVELGNAQLLTGLPLLPFIVAGIGALLVILDYSYQALEQWRVSALPDNKLRFDANEMDVGGDRNGDECPTKSNPKRRMFSTKV